ncbi:D-alanyl-D-alanine carboxypeptidase [Flavisolibacter ginsenosidimutans]|uniref:D-alanyl-D-alanine carboxypeptidase/D-alanyl-D-alanine-endopeptidase n=1 Tax=Flavisolibacter ginsenosidimutans TaxID=661481 RepID=A0A5B8UK54_9BACT|nr:D-alanyl-D-alanine carboxypeptidase [Flavisolibacter ginsenosidimutans]QEC56943.1 hypothetical protein FSB75_13885 [Flavisolibacter ginsenosidimutans]
MRNIIPLFIAVNVFFLSGCGTASKLEKSAREDVLSSEALKTAHVGISVYEPATGKYWFNYQGDKYFVPASNTKIPTCYAAMKYLGDSLVGWYIRESDDTVYLKPNADPTFLHPDFSKQLLFKLLLTTKKKVSYEIPDNVQFKRFGSGWSWNDYAEPYMAERSPMPIYGNLVTFTMYGDSLNVIPAYFKSSNFFPSSSSGYGKNIDITRLKSTDNFIVQKTSTPFLRKQIPFTGADNANVEEILLLDTIWKLRKNFLMYYHGPYLQIKYNKFHSQPTDSLLRPMMHRSDNFFAEQSLLMVSNELLGYMNDEKIIDTLLKTDFKDLPQKPRWVDGSGLSRYNLFTPQDFVFILNKMKNEFGMPRIKNILATGGEGTLSNYYPKEKGFLYAKTGSLSGVVALSGFLTTKKGKDLIFSVQVNNHNGSATDVRRAVEKFIEGIRENN